MTLQFSFTHRFDSQDFAIQCQLPAKGVTAVFGRSGSGKSTLLNVLSGLLHPQSGHVKLNRLTMLDTQKNIHLPVWKRKVAMVFQDARLFPHLSIKENLLFGAPKRSSNTFLNELTALLGIDHLLTAKPNTLSGGEKQRVAIARALLSEPQLLLMDEPLASLDIPRKREVIQYLNQLSAKIEIPIVYVTHSLEEVMHLADHLLVLESGKVVDFGDVETVWNSGTLSLWQEGERHSTLLNAKVAERHEHYAMRKMKVADHWLWVPDQGLEDKVGQCVRIRIDAQDVSVTLSRDAASSIRNKIPVTISEIKAINAHSNLITLQLSNTLMLKSTLTQWATEELNLTQGCHAYAQVKGVSFTQQNLASH
ncbi:molybdenum ABC transporter ATP-binding protein ModC [Vibrio ezurae]|uniref:Molybdate ABC transporter ATP-binding protein ModC n=1 Tax=Vibrio ezurae NBRC 102218 TaxID=1219080 RepID=U3B331_9VIBR|nr:molybdenum ABC transporter ATP-binding protein ModC [Vibrio ezurae]GAD79867.1 molybdate ABC transporter ATP-binding protein ModC [Vibrio ezurae NBRC 102218]